MKATNSRALPQANGNGGGARGEATSTFIRNMRLPVHGWFRFPAGFSADWVRSLAEEARKGGPVELLDPFVGVGTAVLAGEEAGVTSFGLEAQPFIARIARAKLLWHTDIRDFQDFASGVLSIAKAQREPIPQYPPLIQKCFLPETLGVLHSLKQSWERLNDQSAASELTWLALTTILRTCSPAGTAPWQYILPAKSKAANTPPPFEAFTAQIQKMASDMTLRQMLVVKPIGKIFCADAMNCDVIASKSIDLIVTSPPYMNNYDYADATRLELTFWGEINGWGDLHQKARRQLIMSSSQHASAEYGNLEEILPEAATVPFFEDLRLVCNELASERLRHGGKKAYHIMTAGYFADMSHAWEALRRVCREGAKVCFVIGDSAPYGVYVPVDEWMGQLALSAGFKSYHFEKLRDRNIKWKNRKHRVPLKEGRLWVEA